ncbi:hypothetical protein SBF1_4060005 [Candidatus Desulfosporosinus infrequens]|uniref:Uncharacterized protein n=1 Tax=Candidatus Desulfosporosinus infrequens TaxID=2043169 RepID=A0A2U3L8T1_9FIRM|nr:hypothetical protein SBF1_4060005 [Candidatus Desulfosporosinus infrequens]
MAIAKLSHINEQRACPSSRKDGQAVTVDWRETYDPIGVCYPSSFCFYFWLCDRIGKAMATTYGRS